MKASEMIELLQKAIAEHGDDLDFVYLDMDTGGYYPLTTNDLHWQKVDDGSERIAICPLLGYRTTVTLSDALVAGFSPTV